METSNGSLVGTIPKEESQEIPTTVPLTTEVRLFLELAIPSTLLSLSFTVSPFLTASYVGLKFGPTYLSAFTLGNLTGNLCTFSLMEGIFSAAETLSPQAYGKGDYREVGLLAMRGCFASLVLLTPINVVLVLYLEDILLAVGQDPEAAHYATEWYRIFITSLPFVVFFQATWKFLAAQYTMAPLIYVCTLSCGVILPLALEFFTHNFGFAGSAMAYVFYQACQSTLLLCYILWKHPHTAGTWPGIKCWREALRIQPMLEYLHLATGGILAQSEWIYWEALGLIVGRLGVIPLSVHTIPNQVIMTLAMPPYGFGTALALRMGHMLTNSVTRTIKLVICVMVASCALFGTVAILVYVKAEWIIGLFTTDEQVLELALQIWWKVSVYDFTMVIFGLLCGVATGLGQQWSLGIVNFFYLWVVGIPATCYFALIKGGGVRAVWTWMNVSYTMMNITLIVIFVSTNWRNVGERIRARAPSGRDDEIESVESGIVSEERHGLLNGTKSPTNYGVLG